MDNPEVHKAIVSRIFKALFALLKILKNRGYLDAVYNCSSITLRTQKCVNALEQYQQAYVIKYISVGRASTLSVAAKRVIANEIAIYKRLKNCIATTLSFHKTGLGYLLTINDFPSDSVNILEDYPTAALKDNTPVQYLVTKYIPSLNLFELLIAGGRFPTPIARHIFKQIVYQVAQLHKLQIVHRDIKPENILIDDDGNAHLIDFGISWDLTTTKEALPGGTQRYAPPEEYYRYPSSPYGCDLYSLGVLLMVILCSRFPCERATAQDSTYSHIFNHDFEKFWTIHRNNYTKTQADDLQVFTCGALELLNGMLMYTPEARLSLSEILAHSWFQQPIANIEKLRREIWFRKVNFAAHRLAPIQDWHKEN